MVEVKIGERVLKLSNLEKVLYPKTGFTKAEVIDYYARVADVMVPHLKGRCITMRRWPDGVAAASFFEKNCPSHRPDWVETAPGPGHNKTLPKRSDGSYEAIEYCTFSESAGLVWTANLAALELHAPMAQAADLECPTMAVFDLDPGEPAGMRECCQVALALKDVLSAIGLEGWAKTSGSKGMQVYVPINAPTSHEAAATFALAVGQLLARQLPKLVLVEMDKALRHGKVFVDWSQNSHHKTTIAPYSLRGNAEPTVSTPLLWDEVAQGADGSRLFFGPDEVLARIGNVGDVFTETLSRVQALP